ncbi:MAG: primosomal protein N' [Lachnospiraceae bacterium]|nr:primosomal protein N' [Lachnospiraceae bacterium]
MSKGKYANIIIDISHENVDRPYTYRIPDELRDSIDLGTSVTVPFGMGNTIRKGFVVGFSDYSELSEDKLKFIDSVPEKNISLTDSRIELAAWIKRNYGGTFSAALKTVLPVKQKIKAVVPKIIVRQVETSEVEKLIELCPARSSARLRLLNALLYEAIIPKRLANDKLHISDATIVKLNEEGVVDIQDMPKNSGMGQTVSCNSLNLSESQKNIVNSVTADYDNGIYNTYLIYGITGSGKTEVYINIINNMLERGKQAIVLIPEIALTYQTLMRFYNRFGERVMVMNSTLSQGEKYECYKKALNGEADIVIGPRSALFVPFKNLGAIIIDEEHEGTYKSETAPKYHARETAVEIARMNKAVVVLGSATPSIDAYYKAQTGEYKLFELNERLTGNQLPKVEIVDLRNELRRGNRSIISERLGALLEDRLSKGQQSMLFINRRGISGFISCRACGFVVKCPHCDVSLSLHKNGKLMCHYCGYETENIKTCPECGSKYISGFKAGTEQVEDMVNKMFPTARTLRMDADTTKEKDSYEKIISRFLDKEADILIGTQMIVKGHDFKNVTLVGVLAADMSLFEADFKAPERTFQLLTQAAGRAGRGDVAGNVVIQTYQPEHYAITYASKHDYNGFYDEESGYRDLMDYPPAGHMLNVMVSGKKEEEVNLLATQMCTAIRKYFKSLVIGPAPAALSRINDIYRFVFYIKDKNYNELVDIKDYLEDSLTKIKKRTCTVSFDFDPQNMQ